MKSACTNRNVSARARRAYAGHAVLEIAITALMTPGPSAAANASASTIFGNASATSVIRISTLSTQPPKKPAVVPISRPTGTTDHTNENRKQRRGRGAVYQARENVASELVGAQPVRRGAEWQKPVG